MNSRRTTPGLSRPSGGRTRCSSGVGGLSGPISRCLYGGARSDSGVCRRAGGGKRGARLTNEELNAARKIAEEERERYYDLFDTAPEGYLVTDRSGTILEANNAVATLLAIHKDSLQGRNILHFAPEEQLAGDPGKDDSGQNGPGCAHEA